MPSKLAPTQPKAGYSLKVTLDLGACSGRAKRRCCEGIEQARAGGKPADAGAFVALDPRNGQVLAMGSYADASTRTSSPNR